MSLAINTSQIVAIGNYTQLVSMLEDWEYEDELSAKIPEFVRLVEARINRSLRAPEMERLATVTLLGGKGNVPIDFMEARRVTYGGCTLEYVTPMDAMRPGYPIDAFTIIGEEIVIPGTDTGDAQILYWKRIEPLTVESQTNFIILNHPDVYFYGCMAAAEKRSANNNEAAQYNQLFEAALSELISHSNQKRIAGPLRMQGIKQVSGARI